MPLLENLGQKGRSHPKMSLSSVWLWFSLSIVASVLYAIPALQRAFASPYVIQDDARQHVAWMQRFVDPSLFPGDLSADYFQSVAPWAYTMFYRLGAIAGIDPITFSKVLPIILLAISSAYAFGIFQKLLPLPWASFLGVLILNKLVWLQDDLISATPVAFAYPLLLASLYYLLSESIIPFVIAIALLGQTYPQCALVVAGVLVLRLGSWQQGHVSLASRRELVLSLAGLGAIALALLPYVLIPSPYDPVVSSAEARTMFAFSPEGWSSFFNPNPWQFWFCGQRSGMLPPEWCKRIEYNSLWSMLPQFALALSLPWLLRSPQRFPLAQQITTKIWILPQLLLVSFTLFFVAHALIFNLHLPNRYTEHTIRIVMAIALTLSVVLILHSLIRFLRRQHYAIAFIALTMVGTALVLYPEVVQGYSLRQINYVQGNFPNLYEFLKAQPRDSLLASLSDEVNNLPTFAQQSILVGGQGYALPYHKGYFEDVTRRSEALIQAQYSPDLEDVKAFIREFGVDFWLLERDAFEREYVKQDAWLKQYPPLDQKVLDALKQGNSPALASLEESCSLLQERRLTLIDAQCLLEQD